MQKTALLILIGLLIAAGTVAPLPAETRTVWKIGHVRPPGSAVDKDIHRLIGEIAAATEGRIGFEVYAGNRLGDYSVVPERVAFGEVEMFVGPLGTAMDRRLGLAFTPFLVDDWTQARRAYGRDSLLVRKMAKLLEVRNLKLLGGWPVYFGGIALTVAPKEPANPDITKGLILRTPPIRSFELTARELGYTPYPITWTYARMGLKTGLVAGMIGGGAEGYAGLGEMVRYYLPIRDHFEYWFVYMNMDAWKKLSDADRAVFESKVRAMEARRYDAAEAEERQNVEALKKQGVQVVEFDAAAMNRIRDKIRATVWPVMSKEIGPDFDEVVGEARKQ